MCTLPSSGWAGQSKPMDKMTVRRMSTTWAGRWWRMSITWTREMVEILHMEMSREVSWRRERREGRQESFQANPAWQIHYVA